MNLILTTSCNKKCSFCFAQDVLDKNEMSISSVEKIISKILPGGRVKLLGGEPTQNTHFIDILKLLHNKDIHVTLVSNFLFKQEIANAIKEYTIDKKMNFLINVSEVSEKQFETVVNNVNSIFNDNCDITFGYTISLNYDFDFYKKNLDSFKNTLKEKFEKCRISLPLPNPSENHEKMYFYENYEYIDRMIAFVKWGMNNSIMFNLDCGLYPCMFKNEEQKKFLASWLKGYKFGCDDGVAADVIDEKNVQYCYPGEKIIVDINRHFNSESIIEDLRYKKRLYLLTKKLPSECSNCKFLFKECSGPCVGFIKER